MFGGNDKFKWPEEVLTKKLTCMQRPKEGKGVNTISTLWVLHLQSKSTTDQKYLGKTIPESSKNQNLNLLCARASFPGGTDGKECRMAMQKTWVQSLGWENPLEKEMATHSSIISWRIPRTEEPCGYSSGGCRESDRTEWYG